MKKSPLFNLFLALTIATITYGITTNSNIFTTKNSPKPKMAVLADVKIGSLYWMNKNLNVIKFKNGAAIPYAVSAAQWDSYAKQGKAACCSKDFNSSNDNKYGKLYNWYAVKDSRGLAPAGYHIPTKDEWVILINYLQINEASKKMRATSGWPAGQNGSNTSGFTALPATYITQDGYVDNVSRTFFWSRTQYPDDSKKAFAVLIEGTNNIPYPNGRNKGYGVSVRCIKN